MSGCVLIADDVATNRIILKVKLAASRHEVVQADNVDALLELAERHLPDLIILTQHLPGGGIMAACKKLRANPELNAIPVIAVLPVQDRSDRLTCLKAGADEVLAKPLDEIALLALVRNLIRTRSTYNELLRKQAIAQEFGFGEVTHGFTRQARIALVPKTREAGFSWRAGLVGQTSAEVKMLTKAEVLDNSEGEGTADIFVISACLSQESDGLHLVSELRSRPTTRHAVMVVHFASGEGKLATMALDMGADAVLDGDYDGEELSIRLGRLAPRKLETDALRSSLDKQLSLAMTDPLTGLYNRRYAQSYLKRIAQSAQSRRQPFTLMVLDLDRFKLVNDRFGHVVGDEVLIEVAKRLKASLREVDLLARLGGEEFLIALPETGDQEAARAAERLRRVVGDQAIHSPSRGVNVPVTLSIGVFVSGENRNSRLHIDQMIDRADRALYTSKADGRNQITFVKSAA
ncbi:MAG: diguanylate cyclase [Rhodobacteraceae bacterium]|nr:diguanylate cyclase [Paracoccaceae bacterium]